MRKGIGVWKSVWAWLAVLALLFVFFNAIPMALRWPVRVLMLGLAGGLVYRGVRHGRSLAGKRREAVFLLVVVLFNYAIFEFFCFAFDRVYLSKHPLYGRGRAFTMTPETRERIRAFLGDETNYFGFDSELGWGINPGVKRGQYRSNSKGFRGDREYEIEAPEGVVRAVTFGDSYTHCADVTNPETWQAQAEGMAPVEFLNFGVSGYGLTQAYVRYLKDGTPYESDYAFIGFMTNNIQRTINVFRPFLMVDSGMPCAKPYAGLNEAGELVIHPHPLQEREDYVRLMEHPEEVLDELGELDYYVQERRQGRYRLPSARFYQYLDGEFRLGEHTKRVLNFERPKRSDMPPLAPDYEPDSYPFRTVTKVFDLFVKAVEERGVTPLILIFPDKSDMKHYNAGEPRKYETLLEHFRGRGYEFIDFLDVFAAHFGETIPVDDLFVTGHYDGNTNKLVAEHLVAYVKDRPADAGPAE